MIKGTVYVQYVYKIHDHANQVLVQPIWLMKQTILKISLYQYDDHYDVDEYNQHWLQPNNDPINKLNEKMKMKMKKVKAKKK